MKKPILVLFVAMFFITLLFLPQQKVIAGDPGSQSGYSSQNRNTGGFGRPSEAGEKRQFAAAQARIENGQSPQNGLKSGKTSTLSGFYFAASILVLLGGLWTLLVWLRQCVGKNLEQKRARVPGLLGFAFKPWFAPSAFTFLFLAAIVGGVLTANQTVFAGGNTCQGGNPTDPCLRAGQCPPRPEQKFAAAQIRKEIDRPPRGGTGSGESREHSNITFFSSVFVVLGGIWAAFALLRNRFSKRRQTRKARLAKVWGFALEPAFVLPAFGVLFLAAIIGGSLTKPSAVTAERREKPKKELMTGFINPSNKPVFKTTQQIGGGDITQIGPPVFDSAGNRFVRGGFKGTLTIGATTLTATKDFDMFVAKYDVNGNALWARKGSGSTSSSVPASLAVEGATALSVDAGGDVYLGGSFVKTITLQGGANANITLNDNGAAGINYESFVAKYDGSGNLLWARGGNTNSPKNLDNLEAGQNGIDQIVLDSSGSPYIAGFVSGNQFLGSAFTNQGQSDIMLAKLNPANGAIIWKQIIGGSDDDNGLDLKIDAASNLYLIGNFGSPTITFPHGETFINPTDPKSSEGNSTDTFVAKFSTAGVNTWTKDISNDTAVGASQIAVSGAGEIFITGYFFDSVTFGSTVLTETEGGGKEDAASLGGYVAKMDSSGNFVWANQFGGIGESLALDGGGRVYIAGKFYDGGAFGDGTPNAEMLASFGGEDIFVARYDANGDFNFAKPIAGAGREAEIAVGNPSSLNDGLTENNYDPLGLAYNPARGTMFVSGDFQNVIALDCNTLTTNGGIQSYLAELTADGESTSCRIWNGLDEMDNNWDSPDNWNAGILPIAGDSMYVPYTGNDYDPPTYNPAIDIPLSNLSIADDRILTLERPLTVNNRLDLIGGFVDAENFPLLLGPSATALSATDGLVLGKVQKQFAAASSSFTFPVGTASNKLLPNYSPLTLSNIAGAGSFTVSANEGVYPNTATGLPANRASRWWNLSNGGLAQADLTFKYVEADITAGNESGFGTYRIPTGGGTATLVPSSIDIAANTVTALNVSTFSDWTLAAEGVGPTPTPSPTPTPTPTPAPLAVSISDVSRGEGNVGLTPFTFDVSIASRPPVGSSVIVGFVTIDGTATVAGNDYAFVSGTLSFTSNTPTQQQITVNVVGDTTFEPNETFTVRLSNLSGGNAVITNANGVGTIFNDDISGGPTPTPTPGLRVEGDVVDASGGPGGDNLVLANDVNIIRQMQLGLISQPLAGTQFQAADVNLEVPGACGNGQIDVGDVTVIRAYNLGSLNGLPLPNKPVCGPTSPVTTIPTTGDGGFSVKKLAADKRG